MWEAPRIPIHSPKRRDSNQSNQAVVARSREILQAEVAGLTLISRNGLFVVSTSLVAARFQKPQGFLIMLKRQLFFLVAQVRAPAAHGSPVLRAEFVAPGENFPQPH